MPRDASLPRAAAVYCRISLDRKGEALGVERQESACRELAARLGWTIAEVYVDNDISASTYSRKPRPQFDRMLTDLRAGVRDAVIVLDETRLTRRTAELEGFIALADELGVKLANVSGETDLATADGRFRARLMGSLAAHESDKRSERIRAQRAQSAQSGKPHPGVRGYGYGQDRVTVDPVEAEVVREMVRRFLAGESRYAIAQDLNARGLVTSGGSAWSSKHVGRVIGSPRVAGLRVHQGVVVGEGEWQPIIDMETYERVQARLLASHRTLGRPPLYLLTGMLTCGGTVDGEPCGMTLSSSRQPRSRVYACNGRPGQRACQALAVTAHHVEALVTEAVLSHYEQRVDRLWRAEPGTDALGPLFEALSADQARLEELAEMFAAGEITREQVTVGTQKLRARMDRTRRAMRASGHADIVARVPEGQSVREAWERETVEWRRAFVRAAVDSIIVRPTGHRGSKFDPGRVEITYR